ncbi:MAG TPA: riboflavin synthase [Thermoanaerobaculia bacterium]|nr:riboflavin synthase [Thermoanaerobaculia bacterium]
MFTGIVGARASVTGFSRRGAGAVLSVERPKGWDDLAAGESLSVSGVCLTLLPGAPREALRFDLSPETLSRSTLGALAAGRRVNVERALAASDRLGGHVVAGHVDATAAVTRIVPSADFRTVSFALDPSWSRYVVEKGSIALDGVSLTVAALRDGEFDVAVIPHTWDVTTLSERSVGDLVNVEVDVLAKYVERMLEGRLAAVPADERLRRLLAGG